MEHQDLDLQIDWQSLTLVASIIELEVKTCHRRKSHPEQAEVSVVPSLLPQIFFLGSVVMVSSTLEVATT